MCMTPVRWQQMRVRQMRAGLTAEWCISDRLAQGPPFSHDVPLQPHATVVPSMHKQVATGHRCKVSTVVKHFPAQDKARDVQRGYANNHLPGRECNKWQEDDAEFSGRKAKSGG